MFSQLKSTLKEATANAVSRAPESSQHAMKSIKNRLQQLPGDLGRLKESVKYGVNPNHRHDEPHEIEIDRQRTAIAESHRFQSFGDVQEGNQVKWYIDGHDYFFALSQMIAEAKETIFILDWWLSPEMYLRRPPVQNEEWRIDRLLKRKAEEGVKIMIVVYKEVTQTMAMSSKHTKHHLEALHKNIAVMRHPDHFGGEVVLYWSHHEKVVVVDNLYACVGGLDICFGRWDSHNFALADVHPSNFSRSIFAGQDYNNARIQDFHNIDEWVSNQQSRLDTARMPWHDVHMMVMGPVVLDVAQHFVERWNFIREKKYNHNPRFEFLAFPHVVLGNENPAPAISQHPQLNEWRERGTKYILHSLSPPEGGRVPHGGLGPKGEMKVQAVRSTSDWSSGILTEHSIQNAYIQMIAEANEFIYIENQFFITTTGSKKEPVENLIGRAIVERVLSAARSGKKFRVYIIIPAIPGFSGDLEGNSGTLAILGASFMSICRGSDSIFGVISREGFNPHDYIWVGHLRSYDRINNDPDRLKAMCDRSGIDFDHAQAALARVWLGPDASKTELKVNKTIKFAPGKEGGELTSLPDKAKKGKNNENDLFVEVELPESYEEAWEIVHKFEAASNGDGFEHFPDSIAHYCLQDTPSLKDLPWSGTEESERLAWVTEELYIHSKLLIVDDRRVLMGSANLNDRSQNGDHDSEIALIVEDTETTQTKFDGKNTMVYKFAASLRRQLFRSHLGLSKPQFCPPNNPDEITNNMRPVGVSNDYDWDSSEDLAVADPVSDEFWNMWREHADKNADLFEQVFHCVPSNKVHNWKDYREFVPPNPMKPGHVARPDMPVSFIRETLDGIKGHLIPMPYDFLKDEKLLQFDSSVNPITLSIYL